MRSYIRLSALSALCLLPLALSAAGQPPAVAERKEAYFHFMFGNYYEQKLSYSGSQADATHAIDEYRLARAADPASVEVAEALSITLARSGHLPEAITVLREFLALQPRQASSRRLLSRIYLSMSGMSEGGATSPEMLRLAREQYESLSQSGDATEEDETSLGRICRASQDLPAAESAWRRALARRPTHQAAILQLADLYEDQHREDEQLQLLEALPASQRGAETLQRLAQLYEKKEKWALAAEQRRLLLPSPRAQNYVEARQALAADLWRDGHRNDALALFASGKGSASLLEIAALEEQMFEYQLAIESFRQAEQLPALRDRATLGAAICLSQLGSFDEAAKILRELSTRLDAAKDADSAALRPSVSMQLGFAERELGHTAAAVQAYQRTRSFDDAYAEEAWLQVIESYRRARQWEQTAIVAEKASATMPDSQSLLLQKLQWQANMGEYDKAIAAFATLVKNNPGDCDVLMARADLLSSHGHIPEAAEDVSACLKSSDNTAQAGAAHLMAASFYDRQLDFPRAIAEMRAGLRLVGDNASAYNSLAYILTESGAHFDEASALLNKALRQEPANAAYLDSMGWLLFRQGKLGDAEDYLKKALARQENDPEMHSHMAQVLEAADRPNQALREWKRSVQLWADAPASELNIPAYQQARERLHALQGAAKP